MDLSMLIRVYFQCQEEESRLPIHKMVSRIHQGNGLMKIQKPLSARNMTLEIQNGYHQTFSISLMRTSLRLLLQESVTYQPTTLKELVPRKLQKLKSQPRLIPQMSQRKPSQPNKPNQKRRPKTLMLRLKHQRKLNQ
jgi:hypothetical protein